MVNPGEAHLCRANTVRPYRVSVSCLTGEVSPKVVERVPPLCKGRWIAKQDGWIVRKGVAAWGMVSGRVNPSPTEVCLARGRGGTEGVGEGVTNEVMQELTTPHPPRCGLCGVGHHRSKTKTN